MRFDGIRKFVEKMFSGCGRSGRGNVKGRAKRAVVRGIELCEERVLLTVDMQLLADTVTTPLDERHFQSVTDANGRYYFTANDGVHGLEVWTSDGTLGGTQLLKDINPGNGNSTPFFLYGPHGNYTYFLATDNQSQGQLWRTDGTESGTIKLTNALDEGFSETYGFVGDTMYVVAYDQITDQSVLWKTDGTKSGTKIVADLGPQVSNVYAFADVQGVCYFSLLTTQMGEQIWKVDPVTGQAGLVKEIGATGLHINQLFVIDNHLYFLADDGVNGREIWTSDGTSAGTSMVTTTADNNSPNDLTLSGGTLAYTLLEDVTSYRELWILNGATGTSTKVGAFKYLSGLTNVGGKLFFQGDDGIHGSEPWVTDRTVAGTLMLADVAPGMGSSSGGEFTAFAGKVFFNVNGNLWQTDGTTAGTGFVKDITTGTTNHLTDINGANGSTLSLTVVDGSGFGHEWISDGTSVGTRVLDDVVNGFTGGSVSYKYLGGGGGDYFLYATVASGFEFWMTDLTAVGTHNAGVIEVQTDSNWYGKLAGNYLAAGNVFYFASVSGLWGSDGTSSGTKLLKSFAAYPRYFANLNGVLYFAADDGTHGTELWKSDGTSAGTVLVKEINSGSAGSGIFDLTNIDGKLYFFADDGVHGSELWASDGTTAGTALLKDMNPGAGRGSTSYFNPSAIVGFVKGGNGIYFLGNDGVHGEELWRTDGTAAGTSMAADMNSGSGSSTIGTAIWWKEGLFFNATTTTSGNELWKFDENTGTAGLLADLKPGTGGSSPNSFTVFQNKLYFKAADATHVSCLWVTDGTSLGTTIVKPFGDTNPFRGVRGPLVISNGVMYFTVQNALNRELWKSDGTTGGTQFVKDLGYYGDSVTQTGIMDVQGTLYFWNQRALDDYAYDLWKSDGTATGTVLVGDIMAKQAPFAVSNSAPGIACAIMGSTAFWFFDDSVHGMEWWSLCSIPESVGVYRNGTFYLDGDGSNGWKVTGNAVTDKSFAFGIAGDLPVSGDWNADGAKDIGVFRNGVWFLDQNGNYKWNGAAGGDVSFNFGTAGDVPVTGDWNGDGITDVGVYRNGAFYLDLNGNHKWDSAVDAYFKFGNPGDKPVTGDWNGDGKTDVGVFRGATWYLDQDGSRKWIAGDVSFNFGTAGDSPVTGDWNGDGKTDVGVYRSGFYYIDKDGNRKWSVSDVKFGFGSAGDVPVMAGTWNLGAPAVKTSSTSPASLSVPVSAKALESAVVEGAVSPEVTKVKKHAMKHGHKGQS